MFSNKLNDLVHSSNEKNIISYHQNKNTINPQLLAIGKGKVAGYFKLEEQIEDAIRNMFDISFLY